MNDRSDRVISVVSVVLGVPLALVLLVWTGWITVTAFVGGQAPFFFMEFTGFSLLRGLFWLIIIDPLVLTVAYWIFMLVMLPVGALASLATKSKGESRVANHS
jgi:membrane protein YdbS with pleckstrin-like domain